MTPRGATRAEVWSTVAVVALVVLGVVALWPRGSATDASAGVGPGTATGAPAALGVIPGPAAIDEPSATERPVTR